MYGEVWKEVKFDFEYTNQIKIEVSNLGRVRSLKPTTDPNILKGAMVNGYRGVRLKFLKERDPETQKQLEQMRKEIAAFVKEISALQKISKNSQRKDLLYFDNEKNINRKVAILDDLRTKYKKEYRKSELKRTINSGELVHRMVAKYFLEQPTLEHIIVSHLDYNKLNNRTNNIKWMTKQENVEHQRLSPYVIAAREKRKTLERNENSKIYKLSSTKVMLIKKKINQGVALRTLAKSFNITETQLLRIKRGENWANVEAAF